MVGGSVVVVVGASVVVGAMAVTASKVPDVDEDESGRSDPHAAITASATTTIAPSATKSLRRPWGRGDSDGTREAR